MALLGIYLVACGLLAFAGTAKAIRPQDTARALSGLRRDGTSKGLAMAPMAMVIRGLAGAEAALGVAGLVFPHRVLAALVALSYVGFAAFVLYARAQGGVLATCGCFGSPDTPPTVLHSVVDLALAAGGVALVVAAPSGTIVGVLGAQRYDGLPLVAASLLTGALAFAVLSPLARLGALRHIEPTGARP